MDSMSRWHFELRYLLSSPKQPKSYQTGIKKKKKKRHTLRERDALLKREVSTCGLVVKRSRKQGAEAQGSIKTRGHQGSENRPSFPHKVSHLLKKFHLTALMIAYCHSRNLISHTKPSAHQLNCLLLPIQENFVHYHKQQKRI